MSFKIYILRRFLKYSSPIISIFEKNKIKKLRTENAKFQPVFIIGPPRSGSTILFQVLTNYLDVSYITNLVNLAKTNPYFGFYLNDKFSTNKPHNTFSSNFGKTKDNNLSAPNEGLFWYKWIEKGVYFSDSNSLNNKQKKEFRDTIYAIINKYKKPFLIKNLSFSVRLKLLVDIFPEAKYIYIKRNPVYIAQSIIQAKRKLNIPDYEMWSVKPKKFKEFEKSGLVKQVINQINGIEDHINDDKQLIPENNFIEISYEELCSNTKQSIDILKSFIRANYKNDNIENLEIRDKIKIEQSLFDELKIEINKIYNEQ